MGSNEPLPVSDVTPVTFPPSLISQVHSADGSHTHTHSQNPRCRQTRAPYPDVPPGLLLKKNKPALFGLKRLSGSIDFLKGDLFHPLRVGDTKAQLDTLFQEAFEAGKHFKPRSSSSAEGHNGSFSFLLSWSPKWLPFTCRCTFNLLFVGLLLRLLSFLFPPFHQSKMTPKLFGHKSLFFPVRSPSQAFKKDRRIILNSSQ